MAVLVPLQGTRALLRCVFGRVHVGALQRSFWVASLLLVAMPFAPSSFLLLVVRMLLVEMPGAPSSVLAPTKVILAGVISFIGRGARVRHLELGCRCRCRVLQNAAAR